MLPLLAEAVTPPSAPDLPGVGRDMRETAGVDLDGVMTGVHAPADGLSSPHEPETARHIFYTTTDRAEAERAILEARERRAD